MSSRVIIYSGVQLIRPMEKPKKSGELANSGGLVASGRLAKSFEKLIFYSENETNVYKNELYKLLSIIKY